MQESFLQLTKFKTTALMMNNKRAHASYDYALFINASNFIDLKLDPKFIKYDNMLFFPVKSKKNHY